VVEPDVLEGDPLRLDPEVGGQAALEADGHVAQADGPVAGVEQGTGDDPDRVGEVHDPRSRGGAGCHQLGQLEHDRDGAQRLGEAAGAGGLLADAAELEREGLVHHPGPLAADAQLDQDEVGALGGRGQVGGQLQAPWPALAGQDPAGQAADHCQPPGVDVVQHQLVHGQGGLAAEPVGQLGGVGATGADDGDLHPFTPVSVTPSMKARWANRNSATTGSMNSSVAAMVRFHCTAYWDLNCDRPTARVHAFGFSTV
jgi:hypothetical protein